MNKPFRISLITIGSVIGFVLLVLLFVLLFGGAITKSVVEKHSPEWVGRQVTLDRPTINLFTGSVDLTNVHMLEADGKKDFVRFDSLYVQISLFRLLGKEVYLRHIWLTGLNAQVVNGDGGFNFQDIIYSRKRIVRKLKNERCIQKPFYRYSNNKKKASDLSVHLPSFVFIVHMHLG